jgi:hypothetical protein
MTSSVKDSVAALQHKDAKPAESKGASAVEGSAYDIIKARLEEQGRALQGKIEKLNARRLEVFGGSQLSVLANERVRTENNCVPRDILNVGGRLLFGYNVFIGLRKETRIEDVFAIHKFDKLSAQAGGEGFNLDALPLAADSFLKDLAFVKDFTELYKYYRDAELIQLRLLDTGRLLAIFKIGPNLRDVKVMRWSIDRSGAVKYLDNNGLDDHVFPPTHSFEWTRATREHHVQGRFPHINVMDVCFVETTGGDLTIKVENNTSTGEGIYTEPVDDKSQSLDDAQFLFAKVGSLVLLKILPYRETTWRHFVFNPRTKEAHRIDAIAHSCVDLPEDHGIIFPGGFALATGEVKTFELPHQNSDARGLTFERMLRSPNGEDVLYSFYDPATGRCVLLSYNLIDKEVKSPIHCQGKSIFDDGTMIVFRAESPEPTRVHPMRIWQTPFVSPDFAAKQKQGGAHAGSLLVKVGNPEAVRAVSDAHTIRRMIGNQKPSITMYEDLIGECTRVLDTYSWLRDAEAFDLATTIGEVRATGELVIDEFEKVTAIKIASAAALKKAEEKQRQILGEARPDSFRTIDPFLEAMKGLRTQRGQLISLQEERYIDTAKLKLLEKECVTAFDELTRKAGAFLQGEGALRPYIDKHDEIVTLGNQIKQALEAKPLLEELERVQSGLQLLTEVTGQLKIDDASARTRLLEDIADVIAQLNRARAVLDGRRKELLRNEGSAELGAQMKLFAQAIESALSMSDTPERCEQELARLLVTVEELEGRFADLDEALTLIAEKREEVFEALSAKKQQLLDAMNRRAQGLMTSAERILDGVKRRAMAHKSIDELNASFASDPMIEKARAIAEELASLGDTIKSEELLSKLKSARSEAARQVRDKSELFVEGANLVQLGKHRFTTNTQAIDLTMLPRPRADGSMGLALHVTGTDYKETVDDAELLSFADLFDSALVSEDATVARAEFLALSVLFAAERGELLVDGSRAVGLHVLEEARHEQGQLHKLVSDVARSRYDEGYDRGVHDADATRILEVVLTLKKQAGLLRHGAKARALAVLFFSDVSADPKRVASVTARARGAARLLVAYPDSPPTQRLVDDLGTEIASFLAGSGVGARLAADERDARAAALYLIEETGEPTSATAKGIAFVLSSEAQQLVDELFAERDTAGDGHRELEKDLAADVPLADRVALALGWVDAFVCGGGARSPTTRAALAPAALEAVAHLVTRSHGRAAAGTGAGAVERESSGALGAVVVDGLFSQHPRIHERKLTVRLDEILERVRRFSLERVPRFQAFKKRRADVIEAARTRLKLHELVPKVLSSFVRNKLVSDVYLPLVGDNLAKQMGAAGAAKRTDLMGMLLLISPPGYGKTTLIEYVASRLGLVYVKANGPALGHDTTSLDPADAPNATARQEVEKINFAFEMGNNVLLLIDDIQHTHPELLQKFISLCDGTRRIEGVWKGQTKTYDLRGKKVVVCMAGNPYTESGDKFKIPDMLANRADTYNLGDILGGKEREFALSYLENSLTSNATLQPLAAREPADVHLLVRMAQGEEVPTTDLKHGYSGAEIDEIVRVLQRLTQVQQTLLTINLAYISSAATDDRFRTEPPFKLQGSYRNMNKLAEKVVAVMNDDELERLIDDHYRSEAQTLTTGAEQNLLKLAELRGRQTPEQKARWHDVKKGYERSVMQGSGADDPATRVTNTIAGLAQRVEGIAHAIELASKTLDRPPPPVPVVEVTNHIAAQPPPTVNVQAPKVEINVPPAPARSAADPALLGKIDDVIQALQAAKIDVKLTSPAPAGVAELLRLQTILIEASLLPLVRGLASSIEHEKSNASLLEEALAALKALEAKGLPAAQPTQSETYRPFKPKPKGVRRDDE